MDDSVSYVTVTAPTERQLWVRVTELREQGWKCQGGVCVFTHEGSVTYTQAMIQVGLALPSFVVPLVQEEESCKTNETV